MLSTPLSSDAKDGGGKNMMFSFRRFAIFFILSAAHAEGVEYPHAENVATEPEALKIKLRLLVASSLATMHFSNLPVVVPGTVKAHTQPKNPRKRPKGKYRNECSDGILNCRTVIFQKQ